MHLCGPVLTGTAQCNDMVIEGWQYTGICLLLCVKHFFIVSKICLRDWYAYSSRVNVLVRCYHANVIAKLGYHETFRHFKDFNDFQ